MRGRALHERGRGRDPQWSATVLLGAVREPRGGASSPGARWRLTPDRKGRQNRSGGLLRVLPLGDLLDQLRVERGQVVGRPAARRGPASTTTSSSTQVAPALRRSVARLG